jgi:hypothetical protein
MRLIIDSLVAVMLVAVVAGFIVHNRHDKEIQQRRDLARSAVQRLHSQVMLHTAMENESLSSRGYPATIDAVWFGDNVPVNRLLPDGHPWVQLATVDEQDEQHPRKRIATHPGVAQFWYNPYLGIVRARVPADISDASALRIYNYVNDCSLSSIFPTSR